MIVLIILVVIAAIVGFMVMGGYNRLVALNQSADQAFADIDVQLKQRNDLIPNLVETVKGYATHEAGTLEAVIQARNAATQATSGGPKEWSIRPKDVRRFLREYTAHVDLSNADKYWLVDLLAGEHW